MRFVPYEKMNKKQKKEINNAKRSVWGLTDPRTKIVPNKKKYTRKGNNLVDIFA